MNRSQGVRPAFGPCQLGFSERQKLGTPTGSQDQAKTIRTSEGSRRAQAAHHRPSKCPSVRNLIFKLADTGLLAPELEKLGILGETDRSRRRPGDVSIKNWSL